MMADAECIGYSTKTAFGILHEDIKAEVERYELRLSDQTWRHHFRTSLFHHKNRWSVLHWSSCAIIFLQAILLLVAYGLADEASRDDWLAVEAFIILLMLLANIYILVWDEKLYNSEMPQIIKKALEKLNVGSSKGYVWNAVNYLNLNTPISPCIGVQWAYRDREIVNLPTTLLVRGDIIILRPGQQVVVQCQLIEMGNESQQSRFNPGEIFAPAIQGKLEGFSEPQGRTPLEPHRAIVLETPFVESVRTMLYETSNKPNSILENELYIASTFWIEKVALPGVFFLVLLTGVIRYFTLKEHVGYWPELFIVLPVHSILPLTPLVLPVMCRILNLYCAARLVTVFEVAKRTPELKKEVDEFSTASSEIEEQTVVNFSWAQVWHHFKQILPGRSYTLARTANVVHALGHVTSLCCVDKKGILSYANPSAEKVFFFTNVSDIVKHRKHSSKPAGQMGEPMIKNDDHDDAYGGDSYVEVLDLTHNAKNAFGIQFDDPSYKKYLSSLKPLGLNILLNTCNLKISSEYTQFADHVTCAALKNEDAVAVVNKRCLCSLAQEIGFTEQATDIFSLQDSLGVYQHVPEKNVHQFVSRPFAKHRIPMPNIMSVLEQDAVSGNCHLFSQGTADIILDCCTEFWDGSEILPLTPSDRKKILDFYHRTSVSSYCSAYAYRPVMQTINEGVSDTYIELPPVYRENGSCGSPVSDGKVTNSFNPLRMKRLESFHSMDSLLDTDCDRVVDSVNGCYQAQNNQVFIGMVTMQYQAKQDVIQMIDGLEKACIRFVHFSNENELRSRVFSEKMGLEAGWNCHISLLSEKAGCRSSHHSDSDKHKSRTSMQSNLDTLTHPFLSSPDKEITRPLLNSHFEQDFYLSRRLSAPPIMCRGRKTKLRYSSDTNRSPKKVHSLLNVPGDETTKKKLANKAQTQSVECVDEQGHHVTSVDDSRSMDSMEDTELFHDMHAVLSKSGSQVTTNTDSMSGLDTLNRAKLPKGIENIRPHLESVDNVPLLVSLFTDCTPGATQEMIKIMQEHGEVVCCIGSSASMRNIGVFVQADVSFALTPLFPHVCTKQAPMLTPWDENDPSPMDVSAMLNSLACPFTFDSCDNTSIIELICEARHLVRSVRHSLLLMFSCLLTLTLIQMGAGIFCLPPPLSGHHILWLGGVVVPLLSLTLMGAPVDTVCITNVPYGKNMQWIKTKYVGQYLKSYLLRFLPTSVVCLLSFGVMLNNLCETLPEESDATCHILFGDVNSSASDSYWNGWSSHYSSGLALAQNWLAFQLVLYFICTSLSSVHRWRSLWKRSPLLNKFWCIISPVLLLLQVLYSVCDVLVHNSLTVLTFHLHQVPITTWALTFVWPFILIPINELIKFYDIKLMRRHQKRERLNFGTKLGMNSPF